MDTNPKRCRFCYKLSEDLKSCPIIVGDFLHEYPACNRCNARYVTDEALLARNRLLSSLKPISKDCPVHAGASTAYPVRSCRCDEDDSCAHDSTHEAQGESFGSRRTVVCDECESEIDE